MILIVGLGNPGAKYANTRHNIGFKAIDALSKLWNIELNQSKFQGSFGKSGQVILARPSTYMNLSGHFVSQLARYFQIETTQILIIYDEAALPTGVMKLRQGGSSGGHNGIKSVIEQLGQDNFMRLRIGSDRCKAT
ncbi:aminoacyl-tRNA hydrolase [Mycoplasma sp. ATU-Cv-508]|uniref:aminoacyl-tRNA hydrolase n=1 Tax=Mycoplasma sp. ATU-Cv-508 TaxID=2048001 RepID=UPI000FDDB532